MIQLINNDFKTTPKIRKDKSPTKVLKEYADALTKQTNNLMVGEVIETNGNEIVNPYYTLYIRVESLGNYWHRLFEMTLDNILEEYPVSVKAYGESIVSPCEKSLKETLEYFFLKYETQEVFHRIKELTKHV